MPHMPAFDLALSIALGVGLAAAVGFRVFVPMLVMSVAAYTGHLTLSSGFAWLGSASALVMLSVAAVLEILAYYIPGVDNLLDAIATPAALLAGTIVSAAVMTDLPPILKWTTAVIAGGGAAGLTQALTSLLRAKSTVMTGGLGNHIIASGELGGALLVSLLALAAPLAAAGAAPVPPRAAGEIRLRGSAHLARAVVARRAAAGGPTGAAPARPSPQPAGTRGARWLRAADRPGHAGSRRRGSRST